MSDDPTDWRTIALRFADREHRPNWHPEDRPPWPGAIGSLAFRRWIGERLPELDALVKEDQREAIAAALTPEQFARVADALDDPKWAKLDARVQAVRHQLTTGGREPEGRAVLNALKRLDEPKRRGRTRGEDRDEREAMAMAGWDIWKLRKVILPRFWPDEAAGEFHLEKMELAKVAAHRRGCTPQQAWDNYRTERLAGR